MSHLNAPSTKLLGVQCLICSTPLRDAKSAELGIGPVCRKKWVDNDPTITNEKRQIANGLIYEATCCKRDDNIDRVIDIAEELHTLGFPKLAGRVRYRFIHLQLIAADDGWVSLYSPYRRGFPGDLRNCIASAHKRRVDDETTKKFDHFDFHPDAKRRLFFVLAKHFPGDLLYVDKGNDETATIKVPTLQEFRKQWVIGAELRGNLSIEEAKWYRDRIPEEKSP